MTLEFLFILYLYTLAEDRYANTRWVPGETLHLSSPRVTNTSLTGMGFKKQRGKSHQHVTLLLGVSTDCCTQKAHTSPTCCPWIDQPLGRWSPNCPIMQAQRHPSAFSGKASWCQAKWPPAPRSANFRREVDSCGTKENWRRLRFQKGKEKSERKQNSQK